MEESAMKKTATKAAFSIVLVITLLMSFSLPAFAYSLNPYRHKSSKIYYYYDNWVGSRAISFFSTGASAWRARTTEAQILHYSNNPGTGYNVYMCTGNITGVDWDGLTQTRYNSKSPYYVVSQTLTLNMAKTSTWNNDGALKSVVVHEMGHVFGLGDNGKTKTIMNGYTFGTNSRYGGYGLTVPQTDDVNGVNAKY